MSKNQFHFSISERKLFLRLFDIVFMLAGIWCLNLFFDYEYLNFENTAIYSWLLVLICYYYFFGEILELFQLKTASDLYLTLKSLIITVVLVVLFYIFTPKITPPLPQNRLQIIYFGLALFSSILLNRLIYIQFIFSPRFLKNLLLVGDIDTIESILTETDRSHHNRFVGYISNKKLDKKTCELSFYDINTVEIKELVAKLGVNEILIASELNDFDTTPINAQLISLFEKGMSIRSIDRFLESETFKVSENQLISNFYNYFSFSKSHQNNLYVAFKRIFDIFFAILGIAFLIVLIPLVFLFNLLGNRGKLFYLQERVGKNGEPFKIIKFRSMVSNAEKNGAVWSSKGDVRITPFGKILRKARIDEIPQFINVLKGEMSLIGPRPERPEFVSQLEKDIPYYALRHVIKPGLTGWAQVMHKYASSVADSQEKLLYDLYYIKERNLILDLKIVIKTISTVLFFRGT